MASTVGGYYIGDHETQFDGSKYADENCVPTSVANGADDTSGGMVNKTGAQVRSLVKRSEETNPATPGWSIPDAVLGAARLGVALHDKTGDGWATLAADLNAGHAVVLQGDSDQFSNATCSGEFNGPHGIVIHPATRIVGGLRQHVIHDPICKTHRWEYDYIIRRYANKLNTTNRFATFVGKVPKTDPRPPASAQYKLIVKPHALVRVANFRGSCIVSWTDSRWGSKASSAPCSRPVVKMQCTGRKATVVYVTKGKFAGRWVHIGAGVSAVEVKK